MVTPDLPCDDPAAGLLDYAAAVEAAIGPARDDLVLAGHSFGGTFVFTEAGALRALYHDCSQPCAAAGGHSRPARPSRAAPRS